MPIITSSLTATTSSGKISGTGFAKAKMIGSLFIDATISFVTTPGLERPKNISAPFIASAKVLSSVSSANSTFSGVRSVLFEWMTPLLSIITMCFAPSALYILAHAMPAAPAPLTTIFILDISLPEISIAFIMPALVIIAVPC